MHARFGPEIPVCVFAGNLDRHALDSGLGPTGLVDDACLEAVLFGIPEIHPEQHLGPVLGIDASGSGMDGNQRVRAVVRSGKDESELPFPQFLLDLLRLFVKVFLLVFREPSEGGKFIQVAKSRIDPVDGAELPIEGFKLPQDLRGLGRIVPKVGTETFRTKLFRAILLRRDVKDIPADAGVSREAT